MTDCTAMPSSQRPPTAIVLLCALAAAMAALVLSGQALDFPRLFGIDDAQITQVYARNLGEGLGYVFYAGGERVEGSTSFLWTLFNWAAFLTPHPQPVVLGLCIAICAASLLFAARIAQALEPALPTIAALCGVTAILLILDLNFFVWSLWSLMDVGLYGAVTAALAWSVIALGRTRDVVSPVAVLACCALAPLTRPEGIAFTVGLAGTMGAWHAWTRNRRAALVLVAGAGVALASFGVLTLFRLAYFGQPFPNTFYAKVSVDIGDTLLRGAVYAIEQIRRGPIFLAGLGIVGALTWGTITKLRAGSADAAAPFAVVVLACAGHLAITVIEGGDHFKGARLLQPAAPLIAAGAAALAFRAILCLPGLRARAMPAIWLGAAILTLVSVWHYPRSSQRLGVEFAVGDDGRAIGRRLNEVAARHGPVTAGVIAAGGTPLVFRGPVYDLVGLNWVEMAHARPVKSGPAGHDGFDPAVLYRHTPDILPLMTSASTRPQVSPFITSVVKDAFTDPRFQQLYVPVRFDLSDGPFVAFVSRRWLRNRRGSDIHPLAWQAIAVGTE